MSEYKWYGYRRANGKVGARNLVAVMPSVICANDVAQAICRQVQGTVGFKKTGAGTLVLDVGGEGAYEPITLTGQSTVSAATLSAYAARCEQWLEDRNGSATAGTIFFF